MASKGAPEAIADLCRLSPDRRASPLVEVAALAPQGLRVLDLARSQSSALPPAQRLFHFAPVPAGGLTLSLGAGLLSLAWFDLLKLGRRWARARRATTP